MVEVIVTPEKVDRHCVHTWCYMTEGLPHMSNTFGRQSLHHTALKAALPSLAACCFQTQHNVHVHYSNSSHLERVCHLVVKGVEIAAGIHGRLHHASMSMVMMMLYLIVERVKVVAGIHTGLHPDLLGRDPLGQACWRPGDRHVDDGVIHGGGRCCHTIWDT